MATNRKTSNKKLNTETAADLKKISQSEKKTEKKGKKILTPVAEEKTEHSGEVPEVVFSHVGLTYAGAGEESLTDIDFTVKKGETIGIIGGTGSGKSSVVNLIPRFYDATKGSVQIE